jgi:hypothetical protein
LDYKGIYPWTSLDWYRVAVVEVAAGAIQRPIPRDGDRNQTEQVFPSPQEFVGRR